MRRYLLAAFILGSLAQATGNVESHPIPVQGASKEENIRAKVSVYHENGEDEVGSHAFHPDGSPVTMEEVVDKIVKGLEARMLSPREAEAKHNQEEQAALESLHKAEVAESNRKKLQESRKNRRQRRKKKKTKKKRKNHQSQSQTRRTQTRIVQQRFRSRGHSEPRTRSFVQKSESASDSGPETRFIEEGSSQDLRSGIHPVPNGNPPPYNYKMHMPVVDFYGSNAGHGLQQHAQEQSGSDSEPEPEPFMNKRRRMFKMKKRLD